MNRVPTRPLGSTDFIPNFSQPRDVPAIAQTPPLPETLPAYITPTEGTPRVGALSAEAIAKDCESAAQSLDAMANDLKEVAKRCEQTLSEVRDDIAEVEEAAKAIRDRAREYHARIEAIAIMSKGFRDTAQKVRADLNPW